MIFLRRTPRTDVGGSLACPACKSTSIAFKEELGCGIDQYQCKRCGQHFRYKSGANRSEYQDADALRRDPGLILGRRGPGLSNVQKRWFDRLTGKNKGA